MYGKKALTGARRHAWEILYRHYYNSGWTSNQAAKMAWLYISDE